MVTLMVWTFILFGTYDNGTVAAVSYVAASHAKCESLREEITHMTTRDNPIFGVIWNHASKCTHDVVYQ